MVTQITVTPEELRMLRILRDLPDSPLRVKVMGLLEDILTFARNPRCPELQADGVPCARPEADCDQCQVVTGMVEDLKRRIP